MRNPKECIGEIGKGGRDTAMITQAKVDASFCARNQKNSKRSFGPLGHLCHVPTELNGTLDSFFYFATTFTRAYAAWVSVALGCLICPYAVSSVLQTPPVMGCHPKFVPPTFYHRRAL